MELKTFISQTLSQIIDGVAEAQTYAAGKGAIVSPLIVVQNTPGIVSTIGRGNPAIVIDFDVGVTTSDTDNINSGLGIFVGPIGLGLKGSGESTESAVSRIQFKIPMILPSQK